MQLTDRNSAIDCHPFTNKWHNFRGDAVFNDDISNLNFKIYGYEDKSYLKIAFFLAIVMHHILKHNG